MPVDGGMVPFAQSLLPLAPSRDSVVNGGGYVRHQHAKEVEDDAGSSPSIMFGEAPIQEDDAEDDTHQDAAGMRPGVPKFLLVAEMDFEFHIVSYLLVTHSFYKSILVPFMLPPTTVSSVGHRYSRLLAMSKPNGIPSTS